VDDVEGMGIVLSGSPSVGRKGRRVSGDADSLGIADGVEGDDAGRRMRLRSADSGELILLLN
jgi:hypothetical protein